EELFEEEMATPTEESAPPSLREIEAAPHGHSLAPHEGQAATDPMERRSEEEAAIDEELGDELLPNSADAEQAHSAPEDREPESDASASHRIDPASPTGFRLFGL